MATPIFERLNGARTESDPKRSSPSRPTERAKEPAQARDSQLSRTDFTTLKSRIQRRIIAELAPEKARVIFENRDCKVIDITLQPKDKLPAHNAAGRAVYPLTAAKLRFTAGGQSTVEEWAEGVAHWHDGGEHSVENLSAEPVRFLIFEMM